MASSSTALNDDDVYELSPVETAAIPAEWRSAATYTLEMAVKCPHCGSLDTREVAHFGSTSCKALWRCRACREPFDYFKCH